MMLAKEQRSKLAGNAIMVTNAIAVSPIRKAYGLSQALARKRGVICVGSTPIISGCRDTAFGDPAAFGIVGVRAKQA